MNTKATLVRLDSNTKCYETARLTLHSIKTICHYRLPYPIHTSPVSSLKHSLGIIIFCWNMSMFSLTISNLGLPNYDFPFITRANVFRIFLHRVCTRHGNFNACDKITSRLNYSVFNTRRLKLMKSQVSSLKPLAVLPGPSTCQSDCDMAFETVDQSPQTLISIVLHLERNKDNMESEKWA